MNTLNQGINMLDDGFEHVALPPTYEEPPAFDKDVRASGAVLICAGITIAVFGLVFLLLR